MHFGVILPNFGSDSSPSRIRAFAEAAEELGFHSVWATEHIVVGPEGVDPYGRVYDPLITLGWLAGLDRAEFGSEPRSSSCPCTTRSTWRRKSRRCRSSPAGRVTLGVGMGWHRDEFDFMGVPFEGRGRRADEAIRLMRALGAASQPSRASTGRTETRQPSRTRPHYPRSGSVAAPTARSDARVSWATPGIPSAAQTPHTCDR